MNILILIAAVISGMAAIIGAWYGVRSYRELSRPYRIKPILDWQWEAYDYDDGRPWVRVWGGVFLTNYVGRTRIHDLTVTLSWGKIGLKHLRLRRMTLGECGFSYHNTFQLDRDPVGASGTQDVRLSAHGYSPVELSHQIWITIQAIFPDGRKDTMHVKANQKQPATQSEKGSNEQ